MGKHKKKKRSASPPVGPASASTPVGPASASTPVGPASASTPVGPASASTPVGPASASTPVGPASALTPVGPASASTPVGPASASTPVGPALASTLSSSSSVPEEHLVHEPSIVESVPGPSGLQQATQKRKLSFLSISDDDDIATSTSFNSSFTDFIKKEAGLKPEPSPAIQKVRKLRNIIIDGSNVAMEHGRGATFSMQGVELCINYFKYKKHCNVMAFIPNYRRKCVNPSKKPPTTGFHLIEQLYEENFITFTPTRVFKDKTIIPYDDLFIIRHASNTGAVVISNDNFRDLESFPEFEDVIKNRILMYCFAGNNFYPAEEPLGRNGPKLEEFLSMDEEEASTIREKEALYQQLSKAARIRGTEPQEPPTLYKSFSNVHVTEGEDIHLEAKLHGHPTPTAIWTFEKVLLPDCKRIMSYDGEIATLTIKNADTNDEGVYKITLQNSLGEASSKAQVIVNKSPQEI